MLRCFEMVNTTPERVYEPLNGEQHIELFHRQVHFNTTARRVIQNLLAARSSNHRGGLRRGLERFCQSGR